MKTMSVLETAQRSEDWDVTYQGKAFERRFAQRGVLVLLFRHLYPFFCWASRPDCCRQVAAFQRCSVVCWCSLDWEADCLSTVVPKDLS